MDAPSPLPPTPPASGSCSSSRRAPAVPLPPPKRLPEWSCPPPAIQPPVVPPASPPRRHLPRSRAALTRRLPIGWETASVPPPPAADWSARPRGGPSPCSGRRARGQAYPPPPWLAIGRQGASTACDRSDVPLSQWGLDGERRVCVPQHGSLGPARSGPVPAPGSQPALVPSPGSRPDPVAARLPPGPSLALPGSPRGLWPARPRPSPGRILWASPRGLCRPRRLRELRPAPWFSAGPQPARSPAPHPAGAPAAPFSPQQLSRQCLVSIPSRPTLPSLPAASRVRLPTVRFTLSSLSLQLSPLHQAAVANACLHSWDTVLPGAHPWAVSVWLGRAAAPRSWVCSSWQSHPCSGASWVLRGPLPRCLWAFASRAVAEGTQGSGDAVGGLAAVNSLSILQALPAAPRWKREARTWKAGTVSEAGVPQALSASPTATHLGFQNPTSLGSASPPGIQGSGAAPGCHGRRWMWSWGPRRGQVLAQREPCSH
ncbi:uncharacterized protein [Haliaeetus albicilla]|uniref:uncharacterized protein n=1 Tax=Haliaeetus albicilla TaxID=8969 RepID=UPI0037E70AC4